MLLQTNAYFVPPEKRSEHSRLVQRFRHTLARLGCDQFECYEQAGPNWSTGDQKNRFIQIMRFRDRKQQQQVQAAERNDPQAQALIKEFCELINFPYQQQQGYFAVGFYNSVLPVAALRVSTSEEPAKALPGLGEAPEPLTEPPTEPSAGESIAESDLELVDPENIEADRAVSGDGDTEAAHHESDGSHGSPESGRAGDPLSQGEDPDVATADFGDVLDGDALDLDDALGLTPDADESPSGGPKSQEDPTRQ